MDYGYLNRAVDGFFDIMENIYSGEEKEKIANIFFVLGTQIIGRLASNPSLKDPTTEDLLRKVAKAEQELLIEGKIEVDKLIDMILPQPMTAKELMELPL